MRQLLSVDNAADPDCPAQIRIVPGEGEQPAREHLTAVNADAGPDSALAVHRLISETWMFSGSQTSVTAASECWREHFGIKDDEVTDDHGVGWEPE